MYLAKRRAEATTPCFGASRSAREQESGGWRSHQLVSGQAEDEVRDGRADAIDDERDEE
jgi:hypothetical protein